MKATTILVVLMMFCAVFCNQIYSQTYSKDRVILTRYGKITSGSNGEMMFKGQLVEPSVEFNESASSEMVAKFELQSSDVILMLQAQGNSCPGNFVFVTVTSRGLEVTKNFGTCYDEHSTPQKVGQKITFTMPNLRRKGISTYTFLNGVIRKNGKPI